MPDSSVRACPRCGAPSEGKRFCRGCGLNLGLDNPPPSDESSGKEMGRSELPPDSSSSDQVAQSAPSQRRGIAMFKHGGRRIALVFLGSLILAAGVVAWRVKSTDIPIVGDGGSASGSADSRDDAIRDRLASCADAWNNAGQDQFEVTDPSVLVTTDQDGRCVVAFDRFAMQSDGSLGAIALFRGKGEGQTWELYVSSAVQEGDVASQISVARRWETERIRQPNARFVPNPPTSTGIILAGGKVVFDPSAPIPPGVVLLTDDSIDGTDPSEIDGETGDSSTSSSDTAPPTPSPDTASVGPCVDVSLGDYAIFGLDPGNLTCGSAQEVVRQWIKAPDATLPSGFACTQGPAGASSTPVTCQGEGGATVSFAFQFNGAE